MDKIAMMTVFSAVARHGSFTKAADEMNMAVQTVSKYIKTLEEQLQAQLFNRTTRNVSLNETGMAYLTRCNDLLEQLEELESSVHKQQTSPVGKIRITAPTGFGELHLIPALAAFQQVHPNIQINAELTNRRVSLIDEGFDLAIRIGALPDSSMVAKKLTAMRLTVCASPDYLTKFGTPKHPSELIHHNCFVDVNLRHGRHWHFRDHQGEFKVDVSGNFECNAPGAIRRLTLDGLGISMCPMYAISQDLASGNLVSLFENMEAYRFGVYAIYPHRKHLSRKVRVLVDFLANRFGDMG